MIKHNKKTIDEKLIPTKTSRYIDIKKMSPKDIYKVFLLPNRNSMQHFFRNEIRQILHRIDNDGNLKIKRCSKCYSIKPLSDFWIMNSSTENNIRYSSRCKLCAKKKPVEYKRKKNVVPIKPKVLCRIGNYIEYNNIIIFCICSKCRTIKPVSNFYSHKRSSTGYCGHCKECTMKYRKGSPKGNKYGKVI